MVREADVSVFIDSNIVLYALGDDEDKRAIAAALLADWPTISTQVISECTHVLRRKLKMPADRVAEEMQSVLDVTYLRDVGLYEIRSAWQIASRYGFGHYDCLIIAAALSAGCTTLYTEDLQHGQIIDERLTVLNPFMAQ